MVIHCRHLSPRTGQQASAFIRIANEKFPEYKEMFSVSELASLISCTPEIEFKFNGDEMLMLSEWKEFWDAYNALAFGEAAVKLALDWRADTHSSVRQAWVDAFTIALAPFRDPVTLPGDQLTEEERERLKNPDDPLPSPDGSTAATSATG